MANESTVWKKVLRLRIARIVGAMAWIQAVMYWQRPFGAKFESWSQWNLTFLRPIPAGLTSQYGRFWRSRDLESGKWGSSHWNDVEDLPCDGNATLLDVRTEANIGVGT